MTFCCKPAKPPRKIHVKNALFAYPQENTLKPLLALAFCFCLPAWAGETPAAPLTAQRYAAQLGVGMDVDWARTERGIREFDPLAVRDFHNKGLGHIRIRVAGEISEQKLIHLRKIVEACEQYHVVPVIAYQAETFKADPDRENEAKVIAWWGAVARYFGREHPLLGFDLIYEPAERVNRNPQALNHLYEKTIKAIHAIDPQRMVFVAPRLRAAPEALANLKLPAQSSGYVLAEWHIFPWGPQKVSGKYPWTSGTAAEKAAIREHINAALRWQHKTGHASWVGGWSAGQSINTAPSSSTLAFATFMACELQKANIPYALNADNLFYDGEEGAWRPAMEPLLQAMLKPECAVKPAGRAAVHGAPAAASTVK